MSFIAPELRSTGPNFWQQALPAGWSAVRLRHLLTRNDGGVWGEDGEIGDTVVLRSTEVTIDGQWRIESPAVRSLNALDFANGLLSIDDIVVVKASGSEAHIGKAAMVTTEVAALRPAFSNFMQRLRTGMILDPEFLIYFLNNRLGRDQSAYLSSTTSGLRNISAGTLKEVLCPCPSLLIQGQIVAFLDAETERIDTLIDKQKKLIELLKEKRRAVISQAVTKGLDPDVPMKDSGVEWLGDVPAHWSCVGFMRFFQSVVDYRGRTPTKTDEGIFLVTARNVRGGVLDYSRSSEYVTQESYLQIIERGLPEAGHVVFTTEAPLGEVAQLDERRVALAQRIVKFDCSTSRMLNAYFMYFVMSTQFQSALVKFATGSTALGIKAQRFCLLRKLVPPISEQGPIVEFIELETAKLDRLCEKALLVVSLLGERRSALTTKAVTGQIDVVNYSSIAESAIA